MDRPDRADAPAWAPFSPGAGEDGAAVAARVAASLVTVGAALQPIIGARGVAALFQRAVHLAAAHRPVLAGAGTGPMADLDLPAVQARLAALNAAEAAAAGNTLFETMTRVLQGLVGASLTDRLLRQVDPHPTMGQDKTS